MRELDKREKMRKTRNIFRKELKTNKRYLIFTVIAIFLIFWTTHYEGQEDYLTVLLPRARQEIPSAEALAEISGWNAKGLELYNGHTRWLASQGKIHICIPPLKNITVNEESNTGGRFWDKIDGHLNWEKNTFAIFQKYVTKETIVIDFGAWIGPTILYHAQLSKRSYGMEADPVAYATLESNVKLNPQLPITIVPACVSNPQDAGIVKMKGVPGNSMSGMTDKKAWHAKVGRHATATWKVQCYTLPTLMDGWRINLEAQPVLIKIDIESYECKLFPSFYDWLEDKKKLPTFYISFHPEIFHCSNNEWDAVLKVFRMYRRVFSHGGTKELSKNSFTTLDKFQQSFVQSKESSTFLLEG